MPICATNPLNRLSKSPKNLSRTTPSTEFFVHSEGSGDFPQVLNPSILIVWIQLWVVGLKMSKGGICQSPDCAVCCIKLGLEVGSPSGPIREEIFDPVERPVLDNARKGHYVAAAKTRD